MRKNKKTSLRQNEYPMRERIFSDSSKRADTFVLHENNVLEITVDIFEGKFKMGGF